MTAEVVVAPVALGFPPAINLCPRCRGAGRSLHVLGLASGYSQPCRLCGGRGTVKVGGEA